MQPSEMGRNRERERCAKENILPANFRSEKFIIEEKNAFVAVVLRLKKKRGSVMQSKVVWAMYI